jgi:hypothetical protein
MINPNWQRWIKASVIKNFTDPDVIPVSADGDDRDAKERDSAEVRMDGPRFFEDGRDANGNTVYRIWLAINVVVNSVMNRDTYNHERNIGTVQAMFLESIPVKMYGDPDANGLTYGQNGYTPIQLGCLRLQFDGFNGEVLRTNNLGQIEKTYRFQQATIEGHYRMELTNGTN